MPFTEPALPPFPGYPQPGLARLNPALPAARHQQPPLGGWEYMVNFIKNLFRSAGYQTDA